MGGGGGVVVSARSELVKSERVYGLIATGARAFGEYLETAGHISWNLLLTRAVKLPPVTARYP